MKQLILGAAMLMFISSLPADATSDHSIRLEPNLHAQKASFMQAFGDTLPPIGYVTFCRDHQAECKPEADVIDRVELSPRKQSELERVNQFVNEAVSPVTDQELYGQIEVWTYPSSKGDCEDYVLLKRRMLVERGWP
jgi:predicted transglutaminase-like cysteine proteinase